MAEEKDNLLFPEMEINSFKISRVIKRDGRITLFNKAKIADSIYRAAVEVGGKDAALAEILSNKVVALINRVYTQGSVPSVEEIQDLIEKVLVANGHYKTAKAYILYRAEHQRIRQEKDERINVEDNVPYKLLWKVFTWNVDHRCSTTREINEHIEKGTFAALVRESEQRYNDEISKIVDKFAKKTDKIKLFIVAGPSSSGKTTTLKKIGEKLGSRGISFLPINVDNYFKDLERHPKDEYGDYDYEGPEALHLDEINEDLHMLLCGKTVKLPEYDFKLGRRVSKKKELFLKEGEIILIDSLHGLYPDMTASINSEFKFKFYIEALCQIRDAKGEFVRWADLRMLRRMVRDSKHRSYDPDRTVGHWHYVRRSEKAHIVPFINKADIVFNGSLSYELPVYKSYLYEIFPGIIKKYEADPKKTDAFIRAKRVYELLSELEDVNDLSVIPGDSPIREFIGGSSYKY